MSENRFNIAFIGLYDNAIMAVSTFIFHSISPITLAVSAEEDSVLLFTILSNLVGRKVFTLLNVK